jgi:glycerol-3-phosphate dehydrogenase
MAEQGKHALDTVIFGGGAAGLWLLDELSRRGYSAVVLEANDLGSGQTVASQGIIHGGLKYTLSGMFTPSAQSIRDMPQLWRRCLAGEAVPDLTATRLRAEFCYLWRTTSLSSKLAMFGARAGLRIAPVKLEEYERPEPLRQCPGSVARLDEQVIDPISFLANLASHHPDRLLKIDTDHGLEFECDGPGTVKLVRLINRESGEPLDLAPQHVILLAGQGNESLRSQLGLPEHAMQRRPLHMVMARGDLPMLNGHCVDGSATRLTITSAKDYAQRTVWQIGGQIAEQGVDREPDTQIHTAMNELRDVLPGVDFSGTQWATYRVDRAEAASGGRRPEDTHAERSGNTITGWPTKLALVPVLVQHIIDMLAEPKGHTLSLPPWPRPIVAAPPWEIESWIAVD